MARESRTKYAVLGMLNQGPKCGYEIKKELEKSSMFFWNESYGQIYPMLKKLVANGLSTLEVIERDAVLTAWLRRDAGRLLPQDLCNTETRGIIAR